MVWLPVAIGVHRLFCFLRLFSGDGDGFDAADFAMAGSYFLPGDGGVICGGSLCSFSGGSSLRYAYFTFERLGCGSFLPFLGTSSSGGLDLPWSLEVTDSAPRDEDSVVGRALWPMRSTVQKHIDSVYVLLLMVLKNLYASSSTWNRLRASNSAFPRRHPARSRRCVGWQFRLKTMTNAWRASIVLQCILTLF
ncbi:hypothetical protein BS78_10G034100 [Paspalum vaginatum]|nr:hypothetical protein BS78_10G034100 [Paspalum vaginatum]